MKGKKCFKCKKTKPLSDYYKHKQMGDGHLNKCIECTKKDVRRRYHDPESRQKIIEYEKKRAKDPVRKKKALEYQRVRRKRYPEKDRARQLVQKLEKQPCEVCGNINTEAHHTDYNKPLDVKWLCRKHHLQEHNKIVYE